MTGGSREIPEPLLKDGLIIVGVEYRLSPKATTPEMLDDAAASVAWAMDNISRYGGSADKIYLSGHSAGGYLIDMVGLDKSLLAKYGKDAEKLSDLVPEFLPEIPRDPYTGQELKYRKGKMIRNGRQTHNENET